MMSKRGLLLARELRDDPLGQLLAQLDTPLVERVDALDRTLGKDAVLVESNEFPKSFRIEPFGQNCV
jgi:hypothetical protein